MARSIGMTHPTVYRAVIKMPATELVSAYVKYEGPYGSESSARARVTFWRGHRGAEGHVERSTATWTMVPGTEQKDGV